MSTSTPDTPRDSDGLFCRFVNYYTCPKCGHEWSDQWSATCDDDCPSCGHRHVSPRDSDELDTPMTPADALAFLCETAGSFVNHWVEDDGQNATEQAQAEQAERDTETAEKVVDGALAAARAMLAALRAFQNTMRTGKVPNGTPVHAQIDNAIAQAEAAGITAD